MFKGKNHREVLDCFFEYYQEQCEHFICTQKGSFSGTYFSDWYQTKGTEILRTIKENLSISRLDERVSGFVDLYQFYIEAARNQGDEELLLENLFAVPGRMQCEFSEFGFLTTEAIADEQDWLGRNQSMSSRNTALTMKPDTWRKMLASCQYVMESDPSDRALFI